MTTVTTKTTETTTLMLVLLVVSALMIGAHAQEADSNSPRSVNDGVFSPGQAFDGDRLFQRACGSCHSAGEFTGRKFAVRWEGQTLGDLFGLIADTMPEGDPGSLEPEEYAEIVAFLLKDSGYREGKESLPSDLEALARIRIEPVRP